MIRLFAVTAVATLTAIGGNVAAARDCDRGCLEAIAAQYRAAYLAHDPVRAPFAARIRFTENNVEMPFPDGTWDTVTEEIGPELTLADPSTGTIGIFTAIRQREIPGFLAVRLKVADGQISEYHTHVRIRFRIER